MNHIDLFSGIGGFSLAARNVWGEDHNIVAFVEQDKFCQKILKKHWAGTPIFEDIRSFNGKGHTGTVDILTGGFPCQPFSVAGKQRGKEDDRFLWHEMARIIQEANPTWIIGENVSDLASMAQLSGLPDLESEQYADMEEGTIQDIQGPGYLEEILVEIEKMGYEVETLIIPACAVEARHRRDRVWIVANRISMGRKERPCKGIQSEVRQPEGQEFEYICEGISATRNVAYTEGKRSQRIGTEGEQISDIYEGQKLSMCAGSHRAVWPTEPAVGRVANGVSNRVDRLKGLGNAIVPQVAEEIMRYMKELSKGEK